MWFKGKRIILAITGSIAAYKSVFLVRELVKAGAEVQVVVSDAALQFVTPLSLSTLSKKPVLSEYVQDKLAGVWTNHVELALWADAMIIAPASANSMAKMASGQADNLLLTTFLSAKCPVFFAPAMDRDMYLHGSTKDNIEKLQAYGHLLIPAESGELASGLDGEGRMAEPQNIMAFINDYFESKMPLLGKKALVTAGPTYEKIDPVRFIGNYASGKMGFAIADELASMGAEVTLVSGPSVLSPANPVVKLIRVESADEMFEACKLHHQGADVIVKSAAVADYKPATQAAQKMKKSEDTLKIDLVPNPDILTWLGANKPAGQFLVGFALETENAIENAKGKLLRKNLDLIVLNSLADAGAGFGHDTNKVTFINSKNNLHSFELKSKAEVARDLVRYIYESIS
jgi:phosphopantothenoylcysteine decarboxylase / phosphopantothenate---cysteine ligase